ncbi:VOC family protein [Vallitalea guaymasensis]|uniref:VOC family protein n=1 Tax=Vallitalea guaymasensis TaxID=1185412 RepID=UPI0023535E4E|nr:VOC family protein [Vallitalea guaymasensis]
MNDNNIKYIHTNIIAEDWKKLAEFYCEVFNCEPVLPERDLSGEWIDRLTEIDGVRVTGIHLRLPGSEEGPTLEIFEYEPEDKNERTQSINCKGFTHIAFHVDSVEEVLENLLKHGGSQIGEIVKKDYDGIGLLTVVYAKDPEGNFVEIQNWSRQ